MPAKGRKLLAKTAPTAPCLDGSKARSRTIALERMQEATRKERAMNKPLSEADLATPKVTTGPIAGSRKIYSTPELAPDLRVPLREVPLSEGAGEEPVRIYDPSGVYTDTDAGIDVEKGLKRSRIEWVKERGGVEEYQGREIKPVDNGNATGKHLARNFANTPKPMRGLPGQPITQLEWARRGVITKEMIYVAERENLGRKKMLDVAQEAHDDGE